MTSPRRRFCLLRRRGPPLPTALSRSLSPLPSRSAGDFADYGTEIQISDFAKGSGSWHVANQARFLESVDFGTAFDVEQMRPLLSRDA